MTYSILKSLNQTKFTTGVLVADGLVLEHEIDEESTFIEQAAATGKLCTPGGRGGTLLEAEEGQRRGRWGGGRGGRGKEGEGEGVEGRRREEDGEKESGFNRPVLLFTAPQ